MDSSRAWIVYGAMVMSQLLLIGVFLGVLEPQTSADDTLTMVFPAIATGNALLSVTVGRLWATQASGITIFVLRWAFAESITLFGCVLWLMGGQASVAYALMAGGALLVVAQPPLQTS